MKTRWTISLDFTCDESHLSQTDVQNALATAAEKLGLENVVVNNVEELPRED
jgi:hypothetical protein